MVVAQKLADHMSFRMLSILLLWLLAAPVRAEFHGVIIQGLSGNHDYAEQFELQTGQLERAAMNLAASEHVHVFRGASAGRETLQKFFSELAEKTDPEDSIAIFLVGHGSFDGLEYKFNIPGPDLTGADIAALMNALPSRRQLLVNPGSASGAILEMLKNDASRIVITGTRSGNERNATRFGAYFSAALADPAADLNKDEAISVKEAFEYAERRVADYYETEGSLATEHSQLAGDRSAGYLLARLGVPQAPGDDPRLAELMQRRETLDGEILELQLGRDSLNEEEYFSRLQELMIDLALLDGEIEKSREAGPDAR